MLGDPHAAGMSGAAGGPAPARLWPGLGSLVRHPTLAATLVGMLAFGGSALTSFVAGIPNPQYHDEFSYLLAADTFAHGRVTNPTHPMWTHFETFHVIQQPSYASKFPPGQGLVLAAGQRLFGHPVAGVWLGAALMCAAITWMLYAYVPTGWAFAGGLLAALRFGVDGPWAQSYWGGAVAAAGGAILYGSLRRLLDRPAWGPAVAFGAGLAVLANTRPFEGLLVSIPAAVLLLAAAVRGRLGSARECVRHVALPLAGVLLVTALLMGYYDYRVTGNPLRLPYDVHAAAYRVEPVFLWKAPRPVPQYNHDVIRRFHTGFEMNLYRNQHPLGGYGYRIIKTGQFETLWQFFLGPVLTVPLVVMLPWVWRDRWTRLAACGAGIVALGLLGETWVMPHYAAPVTALLMLLVVQALRSWTLLDAVRGRWVTTVVFGLSALGLAWSTTVRARDHDPAAWYNRRAAIAADLERRGGTHLVLVRYGADHWAPNEWVFNGADIDGSRVVWARSMGAARDRELVGYFSGRHAWMLTVDEPPGGASLTPYAAAAASGDAPGGPRAGAP